MKSTPIRRAFFTLLIIMGIVFGIPLAGFFGISHLPYYGLTGIHHSAQTGVSLKYPINWEVFETNYPEGNGNPAAYTKISFGPKTTAATGKHGIEINVFRSYEEFLLTRQSECASTPQNLTIYISCIQPRESSWIQSNLGVLNIGGKKISTYDIDGAAYYAAYSLIQGKSQVYEIFIDHVKVLGELTIGQRYSLQQLNLP